MPESGRLVRRSSLLEGREEGDPHAALLGQREVTSEIPSPSQPVSDDNGAIKRAGNLAAGGAHGLRNPFSAGAAASEAISLHPEGHESVDCSLHTPTKPARAGAVLRSGANRALPGGGCAPPAVTPTTACTKV